MLKAAPFAKLISRRVSQAYVLEHLDGVSHLYSEEPELITLVEEYDWAAVLARVVSHPSETKFTSVEGRTPLHLACELDAPAVVVQSLLRAYLEASVMIGTSGMTPLHIACSSHHASIHVIRVLLDLGKPEQFQVRDLDGDTPLHTACRCGAPLDVLECLLRAYSEAVNQRDSESLTPLLRLWVRYNVILGPQSIEEVQGNADLTGELGEAWQKTELLLRCAYSGSVPNNGDPPGRILHMASHVDCPRSVVRIACVLYPHQLAEMDEEGRTPLIIASNASIFTVQDLSDEGTTLLEDVVYGNETEEGVKIELEEFSGDSTYARTSFRHCQPSVISIILHASIDHGFFSALWPDNHGQLPLQVAVASGKKWNDGIMDLFEAYPEALSIPHPLTFLFPFMQAAANNDVETTYQLLRPAPVLVNERRIESDCDCDKAENSSDQSVTDSTCSETSSECEE